MKYFFIANAQTTYIYIFISYRVFKVYLFFFITIIPPQIYVIFLHKWYTRPSFLSATATNIFVFFYYLFILIQQTLLYLLHFPDGPLIVHVKTPSLNLKRQTCPEVQKDSLKYFCRYLTKISEIESIRLAFGHIVHYVLSI